jgi:multiple sugar transport system substrate-binding protein
MRVRLLTASGLAALVALTACGTGEDKAETPQANSGPVSLRMTTWSSNEAHVKLFNEIAAEYKTSHPNVTDIKFDALPFDTYTTTLTTQIAGGNAPDLAWVLENSAPDFVASGALSPLDDVLEKKEELAPAATALWQNGGKLYGYPFSTSPFGVFVNTDLLKQANQQTATELRAANKWTWENVVAAGKAVQAKTGKQGMVIRDFDYKGWDNLSTLWTGWGAEAWSKDGKTCGFDQPAMVDAMKFLHKGIFTDKAFPGPGTTADFFAGESAFTITQISRASLLKPDGFKWELVPLPTGPKGQYSVIGQGGLGVLKKGKNAAAAADFLKFFTNEANSAKLAQFFPPPRKPLLTAETLKKTNKALNEEQLKDVVINGISTGVVKPSHKGSAEIGQAVRSGLDGLWKPDADVAGVLKNVCTTIQPLLAK